MLTKLERGERAYIVGTSVNGHNTGAALVEVSAQGPRILCNDEEERFRGIKHCADYPRLSIESVKRRMKDMGIAPEDLDACVVPWDYPRYLALGMRIALEHFPSSLQLLRPSATPKKNWLKDLAVCRAPKRMNAQLGRASSEPMIGVPHHDSHAYFSFAVSPFNDSREPVLVSVLDGYGDVASMSMYLALNGQLTRLWQNDSVFDSLGVLYAVISSTQGGWTSLSSEGRYMGAAAWGEMDRVANPFYRQLRQLLYFGPSGQVLLNRALANWHIAGELNPYSSLLAHLIGPAIPPARMWNPDAVLRINHEEDAATTQTRVDLAAALQLVFEDALFHVISHFVKQTGAERLVLTGGTALNCVATLRLCERLDEGFFSRYCGRSARLKVWVPPTPGDAGVVVGAAYAFALRHGVQAGERLRHAYYCGAPATGAEIEDALHEAPEIRALRVGSAAHREGRARLADFLAFLLAHDEIVGVFQGVAETGPRALGHRSIFANPCNPKTLANINRLVKYREAVRPLAPSVTFAAAKRFFELSPAAAADDYNAYNYMVLTARARAEARLVIPAVVHQDGTSRIQIVREDTNPFVFDVLRAMGRRVGAEAVVNTSLNVASPIVQTPVQALEVLRRSAGLTAVFMLSDSGDGFVAWHDVDAAHKDRGRRLLRLRNEWESETRLAESSAEPAIVSR
jgi:carbamoyltransferase